MVLLKILKLVCGGKTKNKITKTRKDEFLKLTKETLKAVSYTHLTLPTNREV